MKNQKWVIFILATLLFGVLVGCNNSLTRQQGDNQIIEEETIIEKDTVPELADASEVYKNILSQEYIAVESAYQQLSESNLLADDAKEASAFADYLSEYINCEGIFVQESEDTGDRYTAEVLFYLKNGEVYCSIDYTGYMGEIADGIVEESDDNDYLYASFPKGDLFGHEQDFQIHFSPELLHVEWADVCEYVLTRGNGDVDYAQDYTAPFVETEVYQDLLDLIDDILEGWAHETVFNAENKTMYIYFSVGQELRNSIVLADEEFIYNWQEVVDGLTDLGGQIYSLLQIGDIGDEVVICCVDALNANNNYTDDEYLLRIKNDSVQYNIVNDYTVQNDSELLLDDNQKSATVSIPTTGERNALEEAYNYLDIMAFSYSGLIEQLEYEGYSYGEAVYAADNCGADWYDQAAYKAADYLEIMSFSKSGLIEQLEYEGFTYDQASYGVNAVY